MLIYLEIGKIISLAGWGVIILFIGLGFLIGLIRGMKKSIYYTILFIVMIVLCWFISMPIAKAMYGGGLLWDTVGNMIPIDGEIDVSSVNSFKDLVRVLIDSKLTEPMTDTVTIGQTLLSNEEAIALIDGLIIMAVRLVSLIVLLVIAKIVFAIIGGLVWVFFLKPPKEKEDGTPYNKHGLIGGLVGGFKGLISSMIVLIPVASLVGVVATLDVSTSTTASQDVKRLSLDEPSSALENIVAICKDFDNGSIAKMYDFVSFGGDRGFDDIVMDSLLSIGVKDEKPIVLRQELVNFISIYNSLETTIGLDNISSYDYAGSLNNEEMVELVKSATEVLGNSRFITYLLKTAGAEATAYAKNTLESKNPELAVIFEDVDLTGKTSAWWKDQITGLGNVYEALADMNVDINAIQSKDYTAALENVTSEKFNTFVDSIFNVDLVDMFINGGLKYAITLLPEEYSGNTDTIIDNLIDADDGVKNEIKCFARLIDVFKSDVKFENGSISLSSITIETLDKIVETEVLKDSVLVNKVLGTFLEKQLAEIEYNGQKLNIDSSIFTSDDFSWQDEMADLVAILEIGLGKDCSIEDLQKLQTDNFTVGKISAMLKADEIKDSKLANELLSNLAPIALASFVDTGVDLSSVVWTNELDSIGTILETLFDSSTSLSALSSFDFGSITLKKMDNLIKSDSVWSSNFLKILLNNKVIDYIKSISVGTGSVTLSEDFNENNVVWKNEFKGILNLALALSNKTGDDRYNDSINLLSSGFGDDVKVAMLDSLATTINEKEGTAYKAILLNEVANSLLKQFLGENVGEARVEMLAITDIADILDDNESGFGVINLSNMDALTTGEMKKTKLISLLSTVEDHIATSTYLKSLMKDSLTFGSTPLDTTSWTNAKWEEEMHCSKTVISCLEADASGNINLSTVSTELQAAVPITLMDSIILKEEGKTNRIVGRSNIIQGLLADALSSVVTNTSTWDANTWDSEMNALLSVAKTLANTGETTVNVAGITSGLSTIKDVTLVSLKEHVPSSSTLQKVFKDALVSSSVIDSTTTITSWEDEMYGLIEVARTFENASDELVLSSLSTITSISLLSMEKIEAKETETSHTNVARSVVLKKTMGDNIGSALGTDMSSWNDNKWDSEIVPIINVMETLTSGTNETPKKERVLNVSDLTFDGSTTIKDITLVALKTNVPSSEALQKMFGDALVSSALITDSSLITSWEDEMYGLIEVARTFENASDELVLSSLSTITSISLLSLNSLKAKETETSDTNVARSVVLKKTMGDNLEVVLSTTMTSWDASKWNSEIAPIVNVMSTMVSGTSEDADKDRTINISTAMGSTTSIKSVTLNALETNVPESEALQNMFHASLKDALGNSIPAPATPYAYEANKTWWTPEMQGIISILDSQVVDGTVKMESLSDFNNLSVSMLNALIDIEDSERVGFKTNVGKTLIIRYAISPSLITFANTLNGIDGFTIDSDYNWDVEMKSIVNIIKAQLTTFNADGSQNEVDESASINVTTLSINLDGTTGKASSAKNKYIIHTINANIDGATTLQYAFQTLIGDMADSTYPLKVTVPNWNNSDWVREMGAINDVIDFFISEDNPDLNDSETFNIYSLNSNANGLEKIVSNSPKSYLLQSMISSALVTAGINRYRNAYDTTKEFIAHVTDATWTDNKNPDWEIMMNTIYSKINFFSTIGNNGIDSTDSSSDPYTYKFIKDGSTFATINLTFVGLNVSDIEILDADDNNYFTAMDATPTHEQLVRRNVEKSLIAEAFADSTEDPLKSYIMAGIDAK